MRVSVRLKVFESLWMAKDGRTRRYNIQSRRKVVVAGMLDPSEGLTEGTMKRTAFNVRMIDVLNLIMKYVQAILALCFECAKKSHSQY